MEVYKFTLKFILTAIQLLNPTIEKTGSLETWNQMENYNLAMIIGCVIYRRANKVSQIRDTQHTVSKLSIN